MDEIADTNLLLQLTSFIGREDDLAAVTTLLAHSRLVTLTGVGGCGKTRLAIQAAHQIRGKFPHGAWLVDLSPVREPELLPQIVAQTLGLRQNSGEPVLESLCHYLAAKHLLLILDNCEHLSDACARLAAKLLSQADRLRILATSREVLGIAGENLYPLSGMACPEGSAGGGIVRSRNMDLQDIAAYDAVRLFLDRARTCAPGFKLSADNARDVVEICRKLDGLPLAIELVSARVNLLTVSEIASRLEHSQDGRFALHLSGPRSGVDPRHRSLYAAIDWSYALLSEAEQILFRRLAVFTTGFTMDTAEAVCMDGLPATLNALEGISSLFSKSLIAADTIGRTQARYRLLETIREYALDKLVEAGEKADLYDRHLRFFLRQAEEAAPRLGNAFQQFWLNWLDGEQDNLHAALNWALESNQIEAGLQMACALVRYWEIRSLNREAMDWFKRLLERAGEDVSPVVRANASTFASFLAMFLGDATAAVRYGREAVDFAEGAGDEAAEVRAFALSGLATGARTIGDYQTSFTLINEAIQYYRETGNLFYLGMGLLAQGDVAIELGAFETARTLLNESLALALEAGDDFRVAHSYNSLGDLARYEGKDGEALDAYQKSETLLRRLDDRHDLASILCNLGRTCLSSGDFERAVKHFNEALAFQQAERNQPGVLESLIGLATVAIQTGLVEEGICLVAACESIGKQPARGVWPAKRMAYEDHLAYAREKLGEPVFQARYADGQAMTFGQAVDFAQQLPWKAGADRKTALTGLTHREMEIAALVGQGKTNSEIAGELTLSKRTVETHVSNILSKLGLTRRTQILRWALEHDLVRTAD